MSFLKIMSKSLDDVFESISKFKFKSGSRPYCRQADRLLMNIVFLEFLEDPSTGRKSKRQYRTDPIDFIDVVGIFAIVEFSRV